MTTYTLNFNNQSTIWPLYQRLQDEGVTDSQLDQVYYETNYSDKERTPIQPDHVIQEHEVLDYALENSERFQLAIYETTDYEVPWALDDLDLDTETNFDTRLAAGIRKTIFLVKQRISDAGYEEGTDRYNELLAVSLYTYVMAKKSQGRRIVMIPKDVKRELTDARLQSVLRLLSGMGGLGLATEPEDCEFEATALEALRNECGNCSERSKILYTIFKMAGLDAQFIYSRPNQEAIVKHGLSAGNTHLSIGLVLENRTRYFDAAYLNPDAQLFYQENFEWWFPISNREALADHHNNLGVDYLEAKDLERAIFELEKAVTINPESLEAHISLGAVYLTKAMLGGNFDPVFAEFNRALEIYPQFAAGRYCLGVAYFEKGKQEEEPDKSVSFHRAVLEFKTAIVLFPNYARAHYSLGVVYGAQGELDLAEEELLRSTELDPSFGQAYRDLGNIYIQKDLLVKALGAFTIAVRLEPDNAEFHLNLGRAYYQMGQALEEKYGHTKQSRAVYRKALMEFEIAVELGTEVSPEMFDELKERIKD